MQLTTLGLYVLFASLCLFVVINIISDGIKIFIDRPQLLPTRELK